MSKRRMSKDKEAEVAAPGSDGWTSGYISSLCAACKELDPDTLECEVRGFRMDMAPPVHFCLEWKTEGEKKDD